MFSANLEFGPRPDTYSHGTGTKYSRRKSVPIFSLFFFATISQMVTTPQQQEGCLSVMAEMRRRPTVSPKNLAVRECGLQFLDTSTRNLRFSQREPPKLLQAFQMSQPLIRDLRIPEKQSL